MIDVKNAKWDLSGKEKYAISWFEENGFDAILKKQYLSKTVFTVSKDDVSKEFELPSDDNEVNVKQFMEQFRRDWDMLCENLKLRELFKQKFG